MPNRSCYHHCSAIFSALRMTLSFFSCNCGEVITGASRSRSVGPRCNMERRPQTTESTWRLFLRISHIHALSKGPLLKKAIVAFPAFFLRLSLWLEFVAQLPFFHRAFWWSRCRMAKRSEANLLVYFLSPCAI